jgi:hypothetical protein
MGKDRNKFDERDKTAIMLLKFYMTDEMFPKVQIWKTSARIWKYLKELHETLNKGIGFLLKNVLFFITMDENASLQDHLLKIKDIREQFSSIGSNMEEEDMLVIMLKILPHAYEHFIETLNIASTNVDLKFDELCNMILQPDRWKKNLGRNSDMEGLE